MLWRRRKDVYTYFSSKKCFGASLSVGDTWWKLYFSKHSGASFEMNGFKILVFVKSIIKKLPITVADRSKA
jgi:hypothetical protein